MSDARFDEILAELRRLSLQVGDLADSLLGLEGQMDNLKRSMSGLKTQVQTLHDTISTGVEAYADLWRRLRGAAKTLDVSSGPPPPPAPPRGRPRFSATPAGRRFPGRLRGPRRPRGKK